MNELRLRVIALALTTEGAHAVSLATPEQLLLYLEIAAARLDQHGEAVALYRDPLQPAVDRDLLTLRRNAARLLALKEA